MDVVKSKIAQIHQLCRKHQVESLYLFGSAATNQLNDKSDIDFLVKFGKIDLSNYFDNYINFKQELKALFNREIDLIEEQTLKNPILIQSIESSKKLIYGSENIEVAI